MNVWLGMARLTIGWLGFQLTTGAAGVVAQQIDQPPVVMAMAEADPYQLSAQVVAGADSATAYLIVRVELPAESYLYSLTQPGELATRVEVALGEDGKIGGAMRPVTLPKVNPQDEFVGGRSEKHFGTIHFVLPIQRLTSRPLDQWEVAVRLNGQVCSEQGSCQLIRDEVITARFAPLDEKAGALLRQVEASHRPLVR